MKALIVVDVQVDFCEGGKLAVAGGNEVAKRIASYIVETRNEYGFLAFSRDWHKPWPDTNGGHFSENPDFVDSWPVHCEAKSPGAELHPALAGLNIPEVNFGWTFDKGYGRPDYSAWQAPAGGRPLDHHFEVSRPDVIDIVGIAGEHCVRATALDAVERGYGVRLFEHMIASVGGPEATKRVMTEVDAAQRA